MKHRFISLLCVFAFLVLALMPAVTVPATAEEEINAFTYYYDHLNERQKMFYHLIKDFLDNYDMSQDRMTLDLTHLLPETPTEDDYRLLSDDVFYASIALAADDPLYTIASRHIGTAQPAPGDAECYFELMLDRLEMEIPTEDMKSRTEARLQQLVTIAGTGDRYTQLRRLVSYLLETSFYDPYLDLISDFSINNQQLATRGQLFNSSIYGLLLEGVSICEGFSQTFKLLCNKLNIPCITMGNNGHAWNLVQMDDGKWYRVDLTNACRLGWDGELSLPVEDYFDQEFLNNGSVHLVEWYADPYMLSLNDVPLVTEFPKHAQGQYQYTGSTTDFSYTVPVSTYTPGEPKFSYRVNDDGKTCTLTNYEGTESGDLTIPETLDGYTVTAIDGFAFYYCTGFTGKLTISDTVETIGKGAFAGCYNLTSVQLPANLRQLGVGAFIGCKGLVEVTLPDLVDTLGDFVFYDCNNLRSVTFGSHIRNMGNLVFTKIPADAVISGPAGSVIQTIAANAGLTFREVGSLCAFVDADDQWEYDRFQHYHTCEHGARFDHEDHNGYDNDPPRCPTCGFLDGEMSLPTYEGVDPDLGSDGIVLVVILGVAAVAVIVFALRKKE